MHQRLCGWIDPGKSGVELDTLCGYVWPDEANAEAMKTPSICRKALAELAAVVLGSERIRQGKMEEVKWLATATAPVYRRNVPLLPS